MALRCSGADRQTDGHDQPPITALKIREETAKALMLLTVHDFTDNPVIRFNI